MNKQLDRRFLRGWLVTVAGVAMLAQIAVAGPLVPPAGPIASTPGPEPRIAINATNTPGDADSLFRITQPGSYYLTGNITGVVNKHGIEIAASGVTLDLNGFDLEGVPGMGAFDGVSATVVNLTNIEVRNGSVRNWGDEGVDLGTAPATNCRIEGLMVSGNAGFGLFAGFASTVSNCSVSDNTSTGINVSTGSIVSNCSAYRNLGVGINISTGCTVSNCTADFNSINGISAANGSTVIHCTVRFNIADGITCTFQCVIRGNTCSNNGSGGDGAGIRVTGSDNRIEDNNCAGADRGIDVDAAGNIIIRNTCSGNTTDWDIVANNIYGPIIDRRIPSSVASTPAVLGTSAASTLGSTDPNANFTY